MKPAHTLILTIALLASAEKALSQQSPILSYSRLTQAQKGNVISRIAEQYLVLNDGSWIQIKKPQSELLASDLENQRVFSSSKVVNYEMKSFNDDLAQHGLIYVNSVVSQSVEGDKYLVDQNKTMIEVPGNKVLTEGNRIQGVAKYVGPYNYTTIMGAPRRVDHFRMQDVGMPTQEQVVAALRSGAAFDIVIPVMHKCPQCGGIGTIRDDPRDTLKSRPCNVCDGKRKISGGQLTAIKQ